MNPDLGGALDRALKRNARIAIWLIASAILSAVLLVLLWRGDGGLSKRHEDQIRALSKERDEWRASALRYREENRQLSNDKLSYFRFACSEGCLAFCSVQNSEVGP